MAQPIEPELELAPAADMHVHLRDGPLMELVTPTIRMGGVNLAYVMPNLIPPITTVEQALSYHSRLSKLAPNVTFMMTLYLTPSLTPETIAHAAETGVIHGVKSYPKGLTTNSDHGVLDYTSFYPIFLAMEKHGLVLNLHGETPSDPSTDTTILTAEQRFLPTLYEIHSKFPSLRIVLEHCTTKAAVEAVKSLGPSVAATITAHHLYLTVDDWSDNPHCFCKPVAKLPSDRSALIGAATSGNEKFFLGTDSAPHPKKRKQGADHKISPGVFTQPYAVPLVAEIFANEGKLDKLSGFVSEFGRRFYRVEEKGIEKWNEKERIVVSSDPKRQVVAALEKKGGVGPDADADQDGVLRVVPFRAGEEVWSCEWKKAEGT